MGLFDLLRKRNAIGEWRFADAPNTVVFTNKHVMSGKVITAVYHDEEDGNWQFHSDDPDTNSNSVMMLVALSQVVNIDHSVTELASMPTGHRATRAGRGASWVIEKQ